VRVQSSGFLAFVPLLDPLIQRLQHSGIHRGDDIHSRIEIFFRHSRLPCVRKAAIHSRITEPHHRDGVTDEPLLALGETLDRMRVAVKGSKVSFIQNCCSFFLHRQCFARQSRREYSLRCPKISPATPALLKQVL
jgi:hypothetical protein